MQKIKSRIGVRNSALICTLLHFIFDSFKTRMYIKLHTLIVKLIKDHFNKSGLKFQRENDLTISVKSQC